MSEHSCIAESNKTIIVFKHSVHVKFHRCHGDGCDEVVENTPVLLERHAVVQMPTPLILFPFRQFFLGAPPLSSLSKCSPMLLTTRRHYLLKAMSVTCQRTLRRTSRQRLGIFRKLLFCLVTR
ncbi:hypothetical protein BaRGS_00033895 [Batillaria attramentaria]|uniref:Uncharacterized protein n=1 Tax=Batillaria attramentaria TaxID=370345 RepID=A0ABD0JJ94_9CAEN